MSSQIAALCLLFKLCPPFHTPLSLSTYLSVVSSDYTCLVPCCSLLSTILSCFAVNTVFRSIAHRFYWWDRSTFYWAEMHKVHIKVYCAHITTSEWKGHVTSATQGDESRKRWRLSSQHDDCGLMTCWLWLWEQGPWSQKIFNTVCGFLQWWQRNKRGSWLSISLFERSHLVFVVLNPCNWSALVNDPWFNVAWRPQIPTFSTTLISKSKGKGRERKKERKIASYHCHCTICFIK